MQRISAPEPTPRSFAGAVARTAFAHRPQIARFAASQNVHRHDLKRPLHVDSGRPRCKDAVMVSDYRNAPTGAGASHEREWSRIFADGPSPARWICMR